jgi:hypothetical protein
LGTETQLRVLYLGSSRKHVKSSMFRMIAKFEPPNTAPLG